jgi:uncharacterized protein YxjI
MNVKERELLGRNSYYFKQLWSWSKVTIEFDIYASKAAMMDNSEVLMQCREDNFTRFTELLRIVSMGGSGPCDITVTAPDKLQIVRIRKGITFSRHKFDIFDKDDNPIGYFYRKTSLFKYSRQLYFFSANGSIQYVLSYKEDNVHAFSLSEGQKVHATITKDFGEGLKEKAIQFVKNTSADDYFVEMSERLPSSSKVRRLVLAAVVIIDFSFYTQKDSC